jgi:nucleoside-diphosphate-sugar epimerase
MKKILVTGGAGFIGYNIAKILSDNKDNEIHIVDDLSKGENDEEFKSLIERKNVIFYNLDLTNSEAYQKIEPGYDQVYHLAAVVGVKRVIENPSLTLKVNVLSTIYLLEYLKEMKSSPKMLFTSSCENYAGSITKCNVPIPTPENIPLCIEDIHNPRWSYAASKILGEIACLHYSKDYGFDTTIVRYHNIYGPRMGVYHVIPEFILRLKKNPKMLEMWGGYQSRTFCYVTDAAKMTIKIMNDKKTTNKVVNIGNDQESVKISSIGETLSRIMKISPEFLERGAPEGSTEQRVPDLTLIKDLGDYVSEVPFSRGIIKTYNWYNNKY